eukprot:jgi/Bigna1/88193/estExt_fgenesh1_pg.C_290041
MSADRSSSSTTTSTSNATPGLFEDVLLGKGSAKDPYVQLSLYSKFYAARISKISAKEPRLCTIHTHRACDNTPKRIASCKVSPLKTQRNKEPQIRDAYVSEFTDAFADELDGVRKSLKGEFAGKEMALLLDCIEDGMNFYDKNEKKVFQDVYKETSSCREKYK